ncbi:hypothetical protein F5Y18DRAFT_367511 [Xylariaceae sp. FL1019]|nr:hypothetical protein F5Y18DRAFT_367511 [Xylariaceae sp. FL1019]
MGADIDQYVALRKNIHGGQVLTPGSDDFEKSLERWSQTCIKQAAVIVKPANAQEASEAVKFATASKIPLTVKCGGHSTSGTSSIEGGMVIDLGLMKKIEVNEKDKTVTFEGGCLWEDIDGALWKHGLATVGGTVNDTGVGGLILGGGYGFLTPKYGLTIDILLEAQIVTADGSILQVSENENPDLFWAIRGAGQSFGIATSFTVRVFDQGPVYSGPLFLPKSALPTLVDFVNFMCDTQDSNSNMITGPVFLPNGDEGFIALIFYNGAEEEGKKFFQPLIDLSLMGPEDRARLVNMKPWTEVNHQLGQGGQPRKLTGGATFVPPLKIEDVQWACDAFFPFVKEHSMENFSTIAWEIVPNGKVRQVDHSATAFAARGNAYHVCPYWQWTDPKLDDTVRAFNRKVVAKLKKSGVQDGAAQYNNYHMDEGLAPEKAYGVNVDRLQKIKEKFDPTNVFHKWHSFYRRA